MFTVQCCGSGSICSRIILPDPDSGIRIRSQVCNIMTGRLVTVFVQSFSMFLMFLKSVYIGIGRFSLLQVPEPSKQNGVPASELNQLSYIYNTYLHPVQCTQLCVPQSTSRFEISSRYHLLRGIRILYVKYCTITYVGK